LFCGEKAIIEYDISENYSEAGADKSRKGVKDNGSPAFVAAGYRRCAPA
jgi:hypothetical protein